MAIQLRQQVLDLIETNLSTGSNITAAEHRAVEQSIVDYVGFNMVAYGRIGPVDIASASQTTYNVNGNLISAVQTAKFEKFQRIRVTIPSGLLTSTNFKVRVDIESNGTDNLDNDLWPVVFKKDGSSTTTFDLLVEEENARDQSIYFHIEVIQLRTL
jgi:hypothetical protein